MFKRNFVLILLLLQQLNFNQCLQSTRKFFLAHPHPPPPSSPFSPPSSEDNYLDPMISPNKRDLKDILMPPPSPQDHSFPSSIHDPDHFDDHRASDDYTRIDSFGSQLNRGYYGTTIKHYPIYVHTYKSTRKLSWDSLLISLPSLLLTMLTTPMLMTLLINILKHIFVIQNVLSQNMLGPSNMNAREELTKIDPILLKSD